MDFRKFSCVFGVGFVVSIGITYLSPSRCERGGLEYSGVMDGADIL